jgi:hypothetical protein
MALSAHSGPWAPIQLRNPFSDGRIPWTSDQPIERPLPKPRTTRTQNKGIHTPNIHASSGIRTHEPNVRAREDSSCLRLRGYCDRHKDTFSLQFTLYFRRVMRVEIIRRFATLLAGWECLYPNTTPSRRVAGRDVKCQEMSAEKKCRLWSSKFYVM